MNINLYAGAEEFGCDLEYPPALKMTVAKVHANCHSAGLEGMYKSISESGLGIYSNGDRVEIELEPAVGTYSRTMAV
jgi:hypothetical protein